MSEDFRPFRVWLGFVAAGLALLLILITPAPTQINVVITQSYGWRADGTWGPTGPPDFQDLTPTHPLMWWLPGASRWAGRGGSTGCTRGTGSWDA